MNTEIYLRAKKAAEKSRPDLLKSDGNLNVSALARASGVTQPTLKRIFDGEIQKPTSVTLRRMAKALKTTIDDLVPVGLEPWTVREDSPGYSTRILIRQEISELLERVDDEHLEEALRVIRFAFRQQEKSTTGKS